MFAPLIGSGGKTKPPTVIRVIKDECAYLRGMFADEAGKRSVCYSLSC